MVYFIIDIMFDQSSTVYAGGLEMNLSCQTF